MKEALGADTEALDVVNDMLLEKQNEGDEVAEEEEKEEDNEETNE